MRKMVRIAFTRIIIMSIGKNLLILRIVKIRKRKVRPSLFITTDTKRNPIWLIIFINVSMIIVCEIDSRCFYYKKKFD